MCTTRRNLFTSATVVCRCRSISLFGVQSSRRYCLITTYRNSTIKNCFWRWDQRRRWNSTCVISLRVLHLRIVVETVLNKLSARCLNSWLRSCLTMILLLSASWRSWLCFIMFWWDLLTAVIVLIICWSSDLILLIVVLMVLSISNHNNWVV